jgi:carboxyl-terminal processing protease
LKTIFLSIILSLLSTLALAQDFILGEILWKYLENDHYSQSKLDDVRSERAFQQFLKDLDGRKQFFYEKDIQDLSKYKFQIDDQFKEKKLEFLKKAYEILATRMTEAESIYKEYLAKPIDFKIDEMIETDYEKRSWVKNNNDFKDLWRKSLKYQVMTEILTAELEQEAKVKEEEKTVSTEIDKNDNKKTKKENKKTAKKEKLVIKNFDLMEKEAREKALKDQDNFFSRLRKSKEIDHVSVLANAVTSSFDPHTTYLPPMEIEDFNINMSGKLEGIGAVLSQEGPYTKVERVVPGSPSWKQKELEAGDIILKVGQADKEAETIVGMDLRDAVRLIRGKKGSEVKLTVKKPDLTHKIIPIIRDVVELEDGYAKGVIIDHEEINKKIGYILVPSFYRDFHPTPGQPARNCTDDVATILNFFNEKKVDGVILDLRNNPGGSLPDSVNMAGLFFPQGPVVQVKDNKGNIKILADEDPSVVYSGPLMVMQNSFSASASEIVAGALKDYERAVVVGTPHTHGKGTVQTVVDLDSASMSYFFSGLFQGQAKKGSLGALKITIQQFYRVDGQSTQQKGVDPHIVFPDQMAFLKSSEQHLDHALPWNKIDKAKFTPWKNKNFDIRYLSTQSQKRQEKSESFKIINERIEFMSQLAKNTVKNLNFDAFKAQRKIEEEKLKALKTADEIKFEANNKNNKSNPDKKNVQAELINHKMKIGEAFTNEILDKKISKKDTVRMVEVEKAKNEEFGNKLKQDVYLEETLFIFKDFLAKNPS